MPRALEQHPTSRVRVVCFVSRFGDELKPISPCQARIRYRLGTITFDHHSCRTSFNFFHKRAGIKCGRGMVSSVSSLAYPNMMPWSPAPTSTLSLSTCTASPLGSTTTDHRSCASRPVSSQPFCCRKCESHAVLSLITRVPHMIPIPVSCPRVCISATFRVVRGPSQLDSHLQIHCEQILNDLEPFLLLDTKDRV